MFIETETSNSQLLPLHSPQSRPQFEPLEDAVVEKKLNHNASERERRKKVNKLYYSLRSLLPPSDQTKKLSIPATVSHVLKYIPELQKEVEGLVQKKEELSSRISRQQENSIPPQKRRRKCSTFTNNSGISSSFVSTSQINGSEIMVQISTIKANKSLLYEALHKMEEDGLLLLNASSFESIEEMVFHNLHFQVKGSHQVEIEILREKILWLFNKREERLS
ncbi:hypothetical protein LguiB_004151 [Lonicera macranthoides]